MLIVPTLKGTNNMNIIYLCVVGSDESLFHANPESDRDKKLLVRLLELIGGGRK